MAKEFRLPSEIPPEEYPHPTTFVEEGKRIVEEAEKQGIVLRIMGGLAIYLHSPKYEELWKRLGRLGTRVFTDIDFASYGKFKEKTMKFFEGKGYKANPKVTFFYMGKRQVFFGERVPMIEVFFDKLEMCHTINFQGRLEADKPTIPIAELLLEKLQIVKIAEKDIKDSAVLLLAHDVGETDEDIINLKAFETQGLGSDWGFWYTSTINLKKISDSLDKYEVLTENDRKTVRRRIDEILYYLEKIPKSTKWKLRAKIGTNKKWYTDVEEWITQ